MLEDVARFAVAGVEDFAAGDLGVVGQHPNQREAEGGFAAAAFADQRQRFAFVQFKRNVRSSPARRRAA